MRQRTGELLSLLTDANADVLMPFTAVNWQRVIAALRPLQPVFFGHPSRIPLHDDPVALSAFRMVLLETAWGRLDMLRAIPNGTYEELGPRAITLDVFGRATRVLGLDDLIESKALLMRDKDRPVVAELRAIRERAGRKEP
jgi:hypothetical protein